MNEAGTEIISLVYTFECISESRLWMYKIITILILCILPIYSDSKVDNNELSLEKFIDHVAKQTKKTILYDDSIKGKRISLANLKTDCDLLKILYTILEFNGYFVEKVGLGSNEVLKVKRLIQGPWTSTPMIFSEEELEKIASEDQLVTMVIELENITAREMQTVLRALRIVNPQGGNIAGVEDSNTLLITDFAPNVNRIYSVVKSMDRKKVLDTLDDKLPIEDQSIKVSLDPESKYEVFVKVNDSAFVTLKDKDTIMSSSSGSKSILGIENNKSISFEIDIIKEETCEMEVQIQKEHNSGTIWSFSTRQVFKKGRKITFTLLF